MFFVVYPRSRCSLFDQLNDMLLCFLAPLVGHQYGLLFSGRSIYALDSSRVSICWNFSGAQGKYTTDEDMRKGNEYLQILNGDVIVLSFICKKSAELE